MEKNKDTGAIWRIEALRGMLKEVHSLFVMFHGSVRALLEKESTGGLTRAQLYPFITDYLSSKQLSPKFSTFKFLFCFPASFHFVSLNVSISKAVSLGRLLLW